MEAQFNRLRGEALDEVAIRERRIADLEAQLLGQQAAAVSIPKSVPVTPKAFQFSPPQTQVVIPPRLGTPATNIVAGSPTNSHNPFAIPITEVGGQNTPTHQVPLPPPLGHPVDFHPPGFPGGQTGGLQMNPEGGCQQGAPSSNPQRMLEDELLRTRELFQNFVTAMQPMLDVLTPEQRMLLANRTGNPGPIVPPVPIASAPMQHNLGNVSGAAHHGAPAPSQLSMHTCLIMDMLQDMVVEVPQVLHLHQVDQAHRQHQVARRGSILRPRTVLTVAGYMTLLSVLT